MTTRLSVIGCCILCCSFGYAVGRITTVQLHASTIVPTSLASTNEIVPTVHIEGIRNGKLQGSTKGSVRLFIGNTQILENDSSFSIASPSVLTNVVSITIPQGMTYVASSKGKKYYSVHSAKGENLSPKNRRYFRTAEAAEAAGYKK